MIFPTLLEPYRQENFKPPQSADCKSPDYTAKSNNAFAKGDLSAGSHNAHQQADFVRGATSPALAPRRAGEKSP